AINGVSSAYSGANYQNMLKSYVSLLNQAGLYAILDLHWTAPGSQQATQQVPMPDQDHSPTCRSQVANTFKGNTAVLLELFTEPRAGIFTTSTFAAAARATTRRPEGSRRRCRSS